MPPLFPALRAAFPCAGPMLQAPYCVGASIGHYVGACDDPFPDENELACHLEEALGSKRRAALGKPRKEFLRRAKRIIDANDAGDTERAWAMLEATLRDIPLDEARLAEVRAVAAAREAEAGMPTTPSSLEAVAGCVRCTSTSAPLLSS